MFTTHLTKHSPLERVWPRITQNPVRALALIVLGVAVLIASARIQVPFWPVKMSMQTFAVMLLSIAYGSRLGSASVVSYLLLGIIGAPVFVSGGGVSYFGGPTTGYLLGFVMAAWIIGRFSDRGLLRTWRSALAVLLVGDLIIMIAGVTWLTTLIGFERALYAGFLIFIPAEALKIVLAASMARLARRVVV